MAWRGRVVAVVSVVAVVAGVAVAVDQGLGPLADPQECVATVGGHTVRLDLEQSENAALIAGIAEQRGLPARAISIALATAYQESKIANIDYGDRDSVGLFQQRPSQGWGTEEEILDPVYATNAFYDELVTIDGYQDMRITEAAQRVQRSGFPEAYEDHADDARALASALSGNSPGGQFHCVVDHDLEEESGELDDSGLTGRAATVRSELTAVFGDLPLGGFAPGGVTTGHREGSAHYDGRAIDVFVRPVNDENRRRGWAIAAYLVAQADRLAIDTLIFDAKIWSAGRSDQGWRDYEPDTDGRDPETAAVLEHRDHVHVDVV